MRGAAVIAVAHAASVVLTQDHRPHRRLGADERANNGQIAASGTACLTLAHHYKRESRTLIDTFPFALNFTGSRVQDEAESLGINLRCRTCRRRGHPSELYVCSGCGNSAFHKTCWDRDPWHETESASERCQRIEMTEYIAIKAIIEPRWDPRTYNNLHFKDMYSAWFGVPYHQEKAHLFSYPRLEELLERYSMHENPESQYLSLVSFFGATGGGKSTLIKALIRNACVAGEEFESPVPSISRNMTKGTSKDVHLYADPRTISSALPIFYAGKVVPGVIHSQLN